MGDRSREHLRSLSSELYGILSMGSSIKDVCKAYKSLVNKWYPTDQNKSPRIKTYDHGRFHEIDEAYKSMNLKPQEEKSGGSYRRGNVERSEGSYRRSKRENVNHLSADDYLFSGGSSSVPRRRSRSTTPSPIPTYLSNTSSRTSSPSKKLNSSAPRNFSPKGRAEAEDETSTPTSYSQTPHSPISSRNSVSPLSRRHSRNSPTNLSRSKSRSCTSETEMYNSSRGTGRRSTTPIIFSQSTARKKPPPVEKPLECTLEELCYGGLRKIKVFRDVISDEGIFVQEEETLTINLKPGWKNGTKVTFERKGDEKPGYLPADIIFLIQERRHPLFTRQGDDLEITVEIPLVEALTGCSISVPLLGRETMRIHFSDIIYPGYEKVIQGQGMPNAKGGNRGDLRITFLVNFPTELTDQQRSEACSILADCS